MNIQTFDTFPLLSGETVSADWVAGMMTRLECVMQDVFGETAGDQLVSLCEDSSFKLSTPAREVLQEAGLIDDDGLVGGEAAREFILMSKRGAGLDTVFIDPFI